MTTRFESKFHRAGEVPLPAFSGTRVMMMPIILGDGESVPPELQHYAETLAALFEKMLADHAGKVGYLTIDEKRVAAGETHRRAGKHVDGVFNGSIGGWGGGGGGGWGSAGNGMLTVSNIAGCRLWAGEFVGEVDKDGGCVGEVAAPPIVLEGGVAYWLDGLCVHESMPMAKAVDRQFVRLSLPSCAPWFDGYSVNPLGVKPTGPILPRREFM